MINGKCVLLFNPRGIALYYRNYHCGVDILPHYIDADTLKRSLIKLKGTANHLLKIWLALKHKGLAPGTSVEIDTSNTTPSLQKLFSFGDPDNRFFIPFAHTRRFMVMEGDAARSIIQTTIQRWHTSDSVVTCNPKSFLVFGQGENDKVIVGVGRE